MTAASIERQVEGALGALEVGGEEAYDGVVEPGLLGQALEQLEKGESLLLRVGSPLGKPQEGYAPSPRDPRWLAVRRGSKKIAIARQCNAPAAETGQARSISIEDDAAQLVWLEMSNKDRWLVAAGGTDEERLAATRCAHALGKALGVKCSGASAPSDRSPAIDLRPLSAKRLARFGLRPESQWWVLRDYGSISPRSGAGRDFTVALIVGGLAIGAWALLAHQNSQGANTNFLLGVGVIAALLSLTA